MLIGAIWHANITDGITDTLFIEIHITIHINIIDENTVGMEFPSVFKFLNVNEDATSNFQFFWILMENPSVISINETNRSNINENIHR